LKAGRCFGQAVAVLAVFAVARPYGLLGPAVISVSLLMLYELGVSIVLLTAIPEEFAFRGVLLGSALRLWGPWRASLVTSALFGLWHIAPTLHTMSDNREFAGAAAHTGGQVLLVLGSVAVTFVAGLVFCWLRLRSRSLIAPVMAHVATNGLALTVAWFAVHQRSLPPRPSRPSPHRLPHPGNVTPEMIFLRLARSWEECRRAA
jgi:uncharacterized protein